MTPQSTNQADAVFGKDTGLILLSTRRSRAHAAQRGVPLKAKCRCCWQNLCRLILTKVWFQLAAVVSAAGWWLLKRDSPSTLAAVAIILVLGSWMMSRERIRRNFGGDKASWGLGGRIEDDWSTLDRPLVSLDEINLKRTAQEKKDRLAFRIGVVCTVLAGIIGIAGTRI
jgi:hypothetical protein